MKPGKYPLQIYRGDTCRWQVKVWADAGRSQPFDLTGLVARSEIRERPSGRRVHPITCHITPPNIVDLEITPDVSRQLPARGVWDLRIVNPANGAVGTILSDTVTVTPDVTGSTLTAIPQLRHA